MQHLSSQDILTMMEFILGPIFALLGFMWYHFNGQFKEIRREMKEEIKEIKGELKGEINEVRGEINGIKDEINGVKDEINGMRVEISGVKVEMKEMEIRLTHKIETSYQPLSEQISMDRERISRIEGFLALAPTSHSQAEIAEKKKYRQQAKVASA